MTIEGITQKAVAEALRDLRRQAGLTQMQLSRRTAELKPPFKKLLASQVSDFERGRGQPSLMSFFSLLVACSSDRATLSFSRFEQALTGEPREELRSEVSEIRSTVRAIGLRLRRVELLLAGNHDVRKYDSLLGEPFLTQLES